MWLHGIMVGGEGASLDPLSLGTWFPQGLLVFSGLGSGGRRGFLASVIHGIELVSAVAVHVMQIDLMKNSSDPLPSPS